jgi:hypothetical protein
MQSYKKKWNPIVQKKGEIVIYIVKLSSYEMGLSFIYAVSIHSPTTQKWVTGMLGGDEVEHSQLTNIQ